MNISSKIKNITSNMISNFRGTLERVNFDFMSKNGKTVNLTHEVYGKNDRVSILLYNPKTKKVILTKQFRMLVFVSGIQNGYLIEVLGGAMDANETPEITAIRETEEAVGYKISSVKNVTTSFLSPGILKEKVPLFIGEYFDQNKSENDGGVAAKKEEIKVLEISFEEAFQVIKTQDINDARTIMLLQYLKIEEIM